MTESFKRSPNQIEYRKNLANNLRELRGYDSGRELADIFLNRERKKDVFKQSEIKYIKSEKERIRKEKEDANQNFRNIFLQILEKGYGKKRLELTIKALVENSEYGYLNMDTAKLLIDNGMQGILLDNLVNFEKLDNSVAEIVIQERGYGHLVNYLQAFEGNIDYNNIALELMKQKKRETLSLNLSKFRGLTKEIAETWIKEGPYSFNILYHLGSFEGLDNKFLSELLNKNSNHYINSSAFAESLKSLNRLDKESANILIKFGKLDVLAYSLESFKGLDQEIAEKLIHAGYGNYVIQYPEKFGPKKEKFKQFKTIIMELEKERIREEKERIREEKERIRKEKEDANQNFRNIFLQILEKGYGKERLEFRIKDLVENSEYGYLNMDTAKLLIDNGMQGILLDNLVNFEKLDNRIAEIVIQERGYGHLVNYLQAFEGNIDYNNIALELMKQKKRETLSLNLSKFRGLTKEIAETWIKEGPYSFNILYHLGSFEKLDNKILKDLINICKPIDEPAFIESLKSIDRLDKESANILLDYQLGGVLEDCLESFKGLDLKIAQKMIEAGYGEVVVKHPEKFGLTKGK